MEDPSLRENEDWARSICARAGIKYHDHYAGLTAHFLSIADRLLDERDKARQVVEAIAAKQGWKVDWSRQAAEIFASIEEA